MSRIGNILMEQEVFEKHRVDCIEDALTKAYSAGLIARFGTLWVGGIGKNSATNWGRYTELIVEGVPFNYAMDNLQWFTEIRNKAGKNQGVTTRKMQFALTLFEAEIHALLKEFGLIDQIMECYRIAKEHDDEECLAEEVHLYGGVAYWEERTVGFTIPLMPRETEVLDAVTCSIMSEPFANTVKDFEELIFNAFIEGQRGLQVGTDDLQALREGRRVA